MRGVTNPNLAVGSVWRLQHRDREIACMAVTDVDMPWVHATVEELPGFEPFRAVFIEQEQALDAGDWERADACYERIRSNLTMSFPDGGPVAEFMVHIRGDGTAGRRWHDEPFDTAVE